MRSGYLRFITFFIFRQLFREANYVLSTTSLLRSLGLSSSTALALSAPLQWVLKDGLGFLSKFISSSQLSSRVDRHPRRSRIVGDSLMTLSSLVEILSVLHPRQFVWYGALGGVLKQMGGGISGPAYRVFLDAFVGKGGGNIGELSARGEVQGVVGKLLGLALGVVIARALENCSAGINLYLDAWFVLGAAHLGSTWQSVQCVRMKTLNWTRLRMVMDSVIDGHGVRSIEDVWKEENETASWTGIRVGVSLDEMEDNVYDRILRHSTEAYVVGMVDNKMALALVEDVSMMDVLKGVLQVRWVQKAIEKGGETESTIEKSYDWIRGYGDNFVQGLEEEGWAVGRLGIDIEQARFALVPDDE